MRIAIVGGTGTLGAKVAGELQARGDEVRVLSRRAPQYPVDLLTGAGLEAALDGCDAVVDASNNANAKKARALLVDGTRRLAEAGRAAGVRHFVSISIVGCEKVPLGYYKVKCEQELEVERGGVPWTIVRATQFHEFVVPLFEATAKAGILPGLGIPMQTVAAVDVARAVADIAEGEPRLGRFDVAGPEVLGLRELAHQWKRARGGRALVVPVPLALPGRSARALRAGALTAETCDVRGKLTFADWLAQGPATV